MEVDLKKKSEWLNMVLVFRIGSLGIIFVEFFTICKILMVLKRTCFFNGLHTITIRLGLCFNLTFVIYQSKRSDKEKLNIYFLFLLNSFVNRS